MANFTCGACQFTTTASDEHIGRSTKCPHCQAVASIVPDVRRGTDPPAASQAAKTVEDFSRKIVEKLNSLDTSDSRETTLPRWAANAIAIAFAILGALSVLGSGLLVLALVAADSAMQEAAVGAMFGALFIAGYVVTRSVEKVIRAMCRR